MKRILIEKNNFIESIIKKEECEKKRDNRKRLKDVYNLRAHLQNQKNKQNKIGRIGYTEMDSINRGLLKKDPITSYGILLFYHDSNNQIWYLLSQRRDTIEYTCYIRGKYTIPSLENYLK